MFYLPPWSNACAYATQGLLGERQTLLARIAEDAIKNRPLCLREQYAFAQRSTGDGRQTENELRSERHDCQRRSQLRRISTGGRLYCPLELPTPVSWLS